ncbi:hypothetical protein GCM10020331_069140 [Ectobacillus funiculus]
MHCERNYSITGCRPYTIQNRDWSGETLQVYRQKKLSLTEEDEAILREYIEKQELYRTLSIFLEEKKFDQNDETVQLLQRLPRLFGGLDVIDEAESLAANAEMKEAIQRVRDIYETVERLGYGHYISVDLGMIQKP